MYLDRNSSFDGSLSPGSGGDASSRRNSGRLRDLIVHVEVHQKCFELLNFYY